MYNLYDKYLRGNSIGCCPLYVGYYLLYVLTWELNRYGDDDDGHTLNHSNRYGVPGTRQRNTSVSTDYPPRSSWEEASRRESIGLVDRPFGRDGILASSSKGLLMVRLCIF